MFNSFANNKFGVFLLAVSIFIITMIGLNTCISPTPPTPSNENVPTIGPSVPTETVSVPTSVPIVSVPTSTVNVIFPTPTQTMIPTATPDPTQPRK